MTAPGIEPVNFPVVAECFSQLFYRVPHVTVWLSFNHATNSVSFQSEMEALDILDIIFIHIAEGSYYCITVHAATVQLSNCDTSAI